MDHYFVDNNVFQRPADFTLGNAPRALGKPPQSRGRSPANLSLGKQFSIREEMNLEFRIEAQNAFNHPVFGTPDTSVDDENFGKITVHIGWTARDAVGGEVQLLTRWSALFARVGASKLKMVGPPGFEPGTYGLEVRRPLRRFDPSINRGLATSTSCPNSVITSCTQAE